MLLVTLPLPCWSFVPSSLAGAPTTSRPSSRLYNVVSQIVRNEDSKNSGGNRNGATAATATTTTSPKKKQPRRRNKLSRPERKAQERANKAAREQQQQQQQRNGATTNRRRKHNYAERKATIQGRRLPGEGRYDLHSTAVSRLTPEHSTADEVMRAIKRAQNLHDVHDLRAIERFLLEQTDESFAYGYRGSLLSRLAVAALHMNHHTLARKAMEERRRVHAASRLPMEAAALIRGLLRVHNVTDALEILEDELPLPVSDTAAATPTNGEDELLQDPAVRSRLKHRARALASVASRHFFEGEPSMAVLACQQMAAVGPWIRRAGWTAAETKLPWTRLLKGAAVCEAGRRDGTIHPCLGVTVQDGMPCNLVYAVLAAMATFPAENSDRIYELVSNALVRRVVFVTGAVNMATCPAADRGEAAFIGRSNVGKSSLINMITARKALAYTSKRPGKTQQFNFFAVNDYPGREKEIKYGDTAVTDKKDGTLTRPQKDVDSFYIVDLPGFGYAKVPEQQRQQWLSFMHDYISQRPTLRVLFHLMDARHGPTPEDAKIMQQIGQDLVTSQTTYVVVLTKADKNVKGSGGGANANNKGGKVSPAVMNLVRQTMKDNGVGSAPVLLSSSQTKLGRDDLWRYVRLAAEG